MTSVLLHWIHTVAAMIWIGGVAFIVFTLLPTLKQTADMPVRQRIMGGMVPRFRKIVGACIVLLIATGIFNMQGKVDFSLWLSTPYGQALAIKICLAAVLFALYLSAPAINRAFKNRECGHGEGAACEHDTPRPADTPKRPDIGLVLHAIVFLLGIVVLFFGKVLTVQ
ncbi:MAG: DUF4149 domain-containing protein [Nitrospirota bacterium]|nr:DUF4149 domain-containing protein [Nitrospirota bacterium]